MALAALVLGAGFLVSVWRVATDRQDAAGVSLTDDAPARVAFKYSILYLFAAVRRAGRRSAGRVTGCTAWRLEPGGHAPPPRGRNWAMLVVLVALCRAVLRHHHRQDDEVMRTSNRDHRRRRRARCHHRRHGRPVVRGRPAVSRVLCRHRLRRHAADRPGGRTWSGAPTHRRALQRQHQPEPAVGFPSGTGRGPTAARRGAPRVLHRAQRGRHAGHRGGAVQRDARHGRGNISTRPPASASTSRRSRPASRMEFPLSFWVDPEIAKDPDTADIHTITLSYTFYPHARRRREVRRARTGRTACRAAEDADPLNTRTNSR